MAELKIPGLKFPEGPRWRDGAWWLSDQLGDRILRVEATGHYETVCEIAGPSGLGFLPDGTLLAALMNEPSLVRVTGGNAEEFADLRGVANVLNDMVVADDGRAYVDAYDDHADLSTQRLVLVTADGPPVVVASDLVYPNGVAITPDGGTLIVSETFAGRLTAFEVEPDGMLHTRRTWASLPEGTHPDGLCLDANLDIWVASFRSGEFLHVREGGEILDKVVFPGRWALSCSLGADDGRTLLMCTAETTTRDYLAGRAVGHLDTERVTVPGVQRP